MMKQPSATAILIPSLNPGKTLPELTAALRERCNYPILLVDDGSLPEHQRFFEEAAQLPGVTILRHPRNLGKGRALKTGFQEFLQRYPEGIGVCTADGDGQHLPEDIIRCCEVLRQNPQTLVLGVRNFSGSGIPWKSYWGHVLSKSFLLLTGLKISDSQTGLRGIGRNLLEKLVNSPGERFEFETVMLLEAVKNGNPIHEVAIQTVYIDGNSETHFDPWKDSIRIYKVILQHSFRQLCRFAVSSLLSFGVDLGLFALLFHQIVPTTGLPRLLTSVAAARACSLVINYLLNRNLVFQVHPGQVGSWFSFGSYLLLCGIIMGLSYMLTRLFLSCFPTGNALLCKTLADAICFLVSFSVQKKYIFAPHGSDPGTK